MVVLTELRSRLRTSRLFEDATALMLLSRYASLLGSSLSLLQNFTAKSLTKQVGVGLESGRTAAGNGRRISVVDGQSVAHDAGR